MSLIAGYEEWVVAEANRWLECQPDICDGDGDLVEELARLFDVSRQATEIHLAILISVVLAKMSGVNL